MRDDVAAGVDPENRHPEVDEYKHALARSPIRILHLTTCSDRVGGAERILIDLARWADRRRWDLTFMTLADEGPVSTALAKAEWPVHSARLSRATDLPLAVVRIGTVLRRTQPDILHTHLWHAGLMGMLMAPFTNARIVQTRHYEDLFLVRRMPVRVLLDRWVAKQAAAIAAVSAGTKIHLIRNEQIPEGKITVIENGVDIEQLDAHSQGEGRVRLGSEGIVGAPILLCAGTFDVRKGHVYLISAFRSLVQKLPRAQLVLLGIGPLMQSIRNQVKDCGLEASVHFLGYRDDAHALMAGADVYVQPSIEEGFGLAVVEAMALNVPVVVSDVGGMKGTVEHGVTGIRVPPREPDALAHSIEELLSCPARAARLAQAARATTLARYSIRRIVNEYDAWYRRLLS
jgi:glycosyltransferase involved in cell wall biosynthesis